MSSVSNRIIRDHFGYLTHLETVSIFRDLFLPEMDVPELAEELKKYLDDAEREDLSLQLSTNPME